MQSFDLTAENLKLLGRTAFVNGCLWLGFSASGCEFVFKGTRLCLSVRGDDNFTEKEITGRPRFAVYIDGKRVLDQVLDKPEKDFTIIESQSETACVVRIVKLSATVASTLAITKLEAEGEISPTAKKPFAVEFIGDSITCAYGVDDEDRSHPYSTATEDATKGYAYLAAELLDCDYILTCKSGHGILSGHAPNGVINQGALMPKYYEMALAGLNNSLFGVPAESTKWDFSKNPVDFVVINLGTNDRTYTLGDRQKCLEYQRLYTEFLKQVRRCNPNAFIICAMGIMGDDLIEYIKGAVADFKSETGDKMAEAFRLTPRPESDGYAAMWHPTIVSQVRGAKEISEYIKSKRV